jgi:hypothetical protein
MSFTGCALEFPLDLRPKAENNTEAHSDSCLTGTFRQLLHDNDAVGSDRVSFALSFPNVPPSLSFMCKVPLLSQVVETIAVTTHSMVH